MSVVLGVRGGISVDHLVAVGEDAQFNHLGGPGLYGALGGRLVDGVSIRLAANLPTDDVRFADLFARLGVDTDYCETTDPAVRVWILNSPEGRRVVETAPPGAVEIETSSVSTQPADEHPVDQGFYAGLRALLDSSPLSTPDTDPATVVGIDPHQGPMHRDGMDYLRSVTPEEGMILPSRVQLSLIDQDPRAAAKRIATELQVPVIARLDRDGIYIVDRADIWSVRDRAVAVRETTGAGDSSAAAIMAALAYGADLVTAAMFGASVARIALAGWGATALLEAQPLTSPSNGVYSTKETS